MTTLRHPMKVMGSLWPAGTKVDVLCSTESRVQKAWPGIKTVQGSKQVAVSLPDHHVIIVKDDQITHTP